MTTKREDPADTDSEWRHEAEILKAQRAEQNSQSDALREDIRRRVAEVKRKTEEFEHADAQAADRQQIREAARAAEATRKAAVTAETRRFSEEFDRVSADQQRVRAARRAAAEELRVREVARAAEAEQLRVREATRTAEAEERQAKEAARKVEERRRVAAAEAKRKAEETERADAAAAERAREASRAADTRRRAAAAEVRARERRCDAVGALEGHMTVYNCIVTCIAESACVADDWRMRRLKLTAELATVGVHEHTPGGGRYMLYCCTLALADTC